MNKIALTAAAVLIATGTAFAGSDNYGSANASQPAPVSANIDRSLTGSIEKPAVAVENAVKAQSESGRGIWGR